jgi:proteasome-associated ATPase
MLVFRKEHGGAARKYALRGKGSALLDGPPGNGKTLLVRALANWLGSISPSGRSLFMNVKPAELHSMWYAQSEANYREIFRAAREAGAADPDRPVVLFFDEIDAIGEARTGSVTRGPGERVLRAFLAELDGLESRGNIVVIGATNRPDLLDPALARSGRMGDKPIHIPRPNRDTARKIFEKHLEPGIPYAAGGEDPALCRSRVIDSALARIFSPNGDGDLCSLTFRDGSKRTVRARDLISGASIAQIAIGAKGRRESGSRTSSRRSPARWTPLPRTSRRGTAGSISRTSLRTSTWWPCGRSAGARPGPIDTSTWSGHDPTEQRPEPGDRASQAVRRGC